MSSRDEFEKWYSEQGLCNQMHLQRITEGDGYQGADLGNYLRYPVQQAWLAWQASRAALVIELPETHKPGPEDDERWHNIRNNTIAACKRAIEAAGVKVKP